MGSFKIKVIIVIVNINKKNKTEIVEMKLEKDYCQYIMASLIMMPLFHLANLQIIKKYLKSMQISRIKKFISDQCIKMQLTLLTWNPILKASLILESKILV